MSKIPWTEKTLNPVAGCTKVSAGCLNCYSEKMSYRLACMGQKKYQKVISTDGGVWNGEVFCDEKALEQPLHWKKPRMIFVNSMSDTFHEKVPFEFIKKMWDVSVKCQQHTFQYLTKRPKIALEFTQWMAGQDDISIAGWPRNCWLGTTCENQEWADKRIPTLLQIPAAVRFISAEPLLGDIDFEEWDKKTWICNGCGECYSHDDDATCNHCGYAERHLEYRSRIDQVIIGAESNGSHPGRECKIEWVRNIVRQCLAAGVAVFVKQIHMWKVGNKKTGEYFETLGQASKFYSKRDSFPDITKPKRVLLKYPRDKDLFPKDLQIREYPK